MQRELKDSGSPEGRADKGVFRRMREKYTEWRGRRKEKLAGKLIAREEWYGVPGLGTHAINPLLYALGHPGFYETKEEGVDTLRTILERNPRLDPELAAPFSRFFMDESKVMRHIAFRSVRSIMEENPERDWSFLAKPSADALNNLGDEQEMPKYLLTLIGMKAVPVLMEMLEKREGILAGAAEVLGKIAARHQGEDWGAVIDVLLGVMKQMYRAGFIAKSLERIGLERLNWEDRAFCMVVLGKVDEVDKLGEQAVPIIKRALDTCFNSDCARVAGVLAIRHPEYDWTPIVQPLLFVMEYNNRVDADFAKDALASIPAQAVGILIETLGDREHSHAALAALEYLCGRCPEETALAIVRFVNGKGGDKLIEISSANETLVKMLNDLMLQCGKGMQDAA